MSFDANAAIEAAKSERKLRKGRNYKKRTSKLDPFRFEIAQMYAQGASLELIAIHIHRSHKVPVTRTTVWRYLRSIGVTQRNG